MTQIRHIDSNSSMLLLKSILRLTKKIYLWMFYHYWWIIPLLYIVTAITNVLGSLYIAYFIMTYAVRISFDHRNSRQTFVLVAQIFLFLAPFLILYSFSYASKLALLWRAVKIVWDWFFYKKWLMIRLFLLSVIIIHAQVFFALALIMFLDIQFCIKRIIRIPLDVITIFISHYLNYISIGIFIAVLQIVSFGLVLLVERLLSLLTVGKIFSHDLHWTVAIISLPASFLFLPLALSSLYVFYRKALRYP